MKSDVMPFLIFGWRLLLKNVLSGAVKATNRLLIQSTVGMK